MPADGHGTYRGGAAGREPSWRPQRQARPRSAVPLGRCNAVSGHPRPAGHPFRRSHRPPAGAASPVAGSRRIAKYWTAGGSAILQAIPAVKKRTRREGIWPRSGACYNILASPRVVLLPDLPHSFLSVVCPPSTPASAAPAESCPRCGTARISRAIVRRRFVVQLFTVPSAGTSLARSRLARPVRRSFVPASSFDPQRVCRLSQRCACPPSS
jgi:hypothetical protein